MTLSTNRKKRESEDNTKNSGKKQTSEGGGETVLSDFMRAAGEPITWIEAIELWRDMRETNNSKFPCLDKSVHNLASQHDLFSTMKDVNIEDGTLGFSPLVDHDGGATCKGTESISSKSSADKKEEDSSEEISTAKSLTKAKLVVTRDNDEEENIYDLPPDAIIRVARGIKETYGIRLSDDKSEFKFIVGALLFLWMPVLSLVIVGQFYSSNSIGSLTWEVLVEAIVLFIAELLWECILSAIVLRYNIKINYTRKLGNLFKIQKYFAADLFPFYESTATSLVTVLAINQT